MTNILDLIEMNLGWIITITGFFIPPMRDFVIKQFQLSLDKALEDKKSVNERKNYISKIRFDKEFEIYQIVSEQQISLVYDVGEAVKVARGMYNDEQDEYEAFMKKFCADLNRADIGLKQYASFISKDIYEKYKQLDSLSKDIFKLSLFIYQNQDGSSIFRYHNMIYNRMTAKEFIEKTQKEISDLSDEIIDFVREYLLSLDVL